MDLGTFILVAAEHTSGWVSLFIASGWIVCFVAIGAGSPWVSWVLPDHNAFGRILLSWQERQVAFRSSTDDRFFDFAPKTTSGALPPGSP